MIFSPYSDYTEEQLANRERYNRLRNEKYEVARELEVEMSHFDLLDQNWKQSKRMLLIWGIFYAISLLVVIVLPELQYFGILVIKESDKTLTIFLFCIMFNILAAFFFFSIAIRHAVNYSISDWAGKLAEKFEHEQAYKIKEASAKKLRMLENRIHDIEYEMSQIPDR